MTRVDMGIVLVGSKELGYCLQPAFWGGDSYLTQNLNPKTLV